MATSDTATVDDPSSVELTDKPDTCSNCGVEKRGPFCAACGQNSRNYLRSAFPVMGEMLAETFETDSRLVVTVTALFSRPGQLSLEFSRNRRARYLQPFRLYLFTSLLFFFMLSITIDLPSGYIQGEAPPFEMTGPSAQQTTPQTPEQAAGVARLKAELDELRRRKIDDMRARPDSLIYKLLAATAEGIPEERYARMRPVPRYLLGQGVDVLHRPWAAADQFVEYLPVAMFFVLPLYALLLKLLYIRRRRFYAEHLVFGMHIHTVAFIVFTVILLTPQDGWMEWIDDGLSLALFAYYFLALRRYYGESGRSTMVKFSLLLIMYSALLGIVLVGALVAVLLLF